ncbi:hypothetical protein EJ04DRAFT_558312 [Polyplosphaeria fusca]|uniref:HMG box domain-containing protein n=1 Tax=Polyplosphaeria fusca TaxID=682080 RepID=A0A9P4R8E6_9PLEO|nr:hypothetical protein EJ04DRAFT_558312 [Polyplosphaeria fusca]
MDDGKYTRSLRSRHTDSQTTSPVGSVEQQQLPSPAPTSPRLARKRASSFDDDVNGEDHASSSPTDTRDLPSASSAGSGELPGHVCLCQPEPKVPRPRNAFILYRQHHQHAVVARNPGLANPEVSKILGERWKAEPEQIKKEWQDLALEEKSRHSELYPDYRYQPRRVGKASSIPSTPSGQFSPVEKFRCGKCGGRSIKTPSVSSNPPSVVNTPTLPPPNISENLTPTTRYLPMMTTNLSLESPAYRRRATGSSNLGHHHMVQSPDVAMYSPLTSDSKRRRYNYQMTNSNGRRPDGQYYSHGRRDSLPPISSARVSPPNSATMPPPRTPRRSSVDLSVLVPQNHDQSRSVEAMVMSVPYPVKIKVLGKITPPLKAPGPTSPAIEVRGAIVAIEGDDNDAIAELSSWLNDFLSKEPDYYPKLTDPPKAPSDDKTDVTFEDYLGLVRDWHAKSKEMIDYITRPIKPPTYTLAPEAPMLEKSTSKSKSKPKDADPKPKDAASSPPQLDAVKPIVILPTYQLRASDVYSSKIAIQDAYSPTDHWQWMATLWRGTVGPDLTIYIHDYSSKDGVGNAKLVDLNDEVGCMTVRKEKGAGFDAGALRRVGFEVSEWIRGVGKRV